MRKTIGMQSNQNARTNREQAKQHPSRNQGHERIPARCNTGRLRLRERINNPAKQDRLSKLSGGQGHIGQSQDHAKPRFRAELFEHPPIDCR